jgi:hypothetical protein
MPAENRSARPVEDRTGGCDLLGGGITSHATDWTDSDQSGMFTATCAQYLGALMTAGTSQEAARLLLDYQPVTWPEPLHRIAYRGIRGAVDAGRVPTPINVSDVVRRSGIEIPASLRGNIVVGIHALFDNAPPAAFAADLYAQMTDIIRRQRLAAACERVIVVGKTGDLADVVAVIDSVLLPVLVEVGALELAQ